MIASGRSSARDESGNERIDEGASSSNKSDEVSS